MIALLVRILGPHHRKHIAILLAAAVACVLAGGAGFAATQHLPVTTGWYWAITTATTVGYGDVTPHNAAGRVIASLVMLITIPLLASVFALATGQAAANGIRRVLAMRSHFPPSPYRLVIGMNPMVPAIVDELVRAGVAVVLVADVDPITLPAQVHLIRGDPTEEATIRQARPAEAEQALITGPSDGDVLVTSVLVRRQAPDLILAALVSAPSVRDALIDLGVQQVLSVTGMVAATLAKSLETPHAADAVAQLVEADNHRLSEAPAGPAIVGRPLSSVRAEREGLVLGIVHDGQFTLGLADDPIVQAGDSLLLAEQREAQRLERRH